MVIFRKNDVFKVEMSNKPVFTLFNEQFIEKKTQNSFLTSEPIIQLNIPILID